MITAIGEFIVDLKEFEGPLHLLLELARSAKIDLRQISLVALADQFLAYLEAVRAARIEIAAEYLVMAAWLTLLKSELLLPPQYRPEPDAEAMATNLRSQLLALEQVRKAVAWLAARPSLGATRFGRGRDQRPPRQVKPRWTASLGELLAAYGVAANRIASPAVRLPPRRKFDIEAAMARVARLLTGKDWRELRSFLPPALADGDEARAVLAAHLVAGLELARTGAIDLRQAMPFGPIMLRRR